MKRKEKTITKLNVYIEQKHLRMNFYLFIYFFMLIKTIYNKNLVTDCQQITFVTLNVFCNPPPSPPPPGIPLFLADNINLDGIPRKLNKKYASVICIVLYFNCISSYERTSYKKLQNPATSFFISTCFTSDFINIIFFNFSNCIQHYLKKDIYYEFSLFNGMT